MQNTPVKNTECDDNEEPSCETSPSQVTLNPNKKLVQQAFHPSLFIQRPRSSSLGNIPTSESTNVERKNEESAPCPPSWQKVPVNKNPSKKRKMAKSPSPDPVKVKNQFEGLT